MKYDSYTHVALIKGEVCVRLRDAESKSPSYYKIPYQPRVFLQCQPHEQSGNWRTLDETPLKERRFDNLDAYHAYVKMAEQDKRQLFGVISPIQQFMSEHVNKECGLLFNQLRTVYLDIEVDSTGGFASPENPTRAVTAVGVCVWGQFTVWGCKPYTPKSPNVTYVQCVDEPDLLKKFALWWSKDYPDIVAGWNILTYDIPYLVNRVDRLNDEGRMKIKSTQLSPWRKIAAKRIVVMGRDSEVPDIVGVAILDQMELYKKFSSQKASYRLGDVAQEELGRTKVDYEEYGSLQALADQDYEKFIDYNIGDVELLVALNDKLHHLDLCTQIAYGSRVNFSDTSGQVRLWDSMMFYELAEQEISVPPNERREKVDYEGGYVKVPHVGQHSWVVSFDVNSLYPTIMRQWNISPDRHLSTEWLQKRLSQIRNQFGVSRMATAPAVDECEPREWLYDVDEHDAPIVCWALEQLLDQLETTTVPIMLEDLTINSDPWPWTRVLSVSVTPNKQTFRMDSPGFLPAILERLYEERKIAKKKAVSLKQQAEKEPDPTKKSALAQEAMQWDLQQNVRKINLNSCYGAFGNKGFRHFDVRQAEAVTTTGQTIIQFVAHRVNEHMNKEFQTESDYVLASDTDSVYMTLAPVVSATPHGKAVDTLDEYCEKTLQPVIDRAFEDLATMFNTSEQILAMKREAIAEYAVWKAAKNYILWVHDNEGVRYTPPKLKIVGIEAVKSSTPKFARDVMKKALELFVRGQKTEFWDLLDATEREFETRPFEDIASPRTCNGLEKYPLLGNGRFSLKTPPQVKGALLYNLFLEESGLSSKYPMIHSGEKIRFCPLVKHNPLNSNVVAAPKTLPKEWKMEPFLDRMDQFRKTVLNPLEKIVVHGGWTVRETTSFDSLE